MTTHQKQFAAAIEHVLAIIRAYGVTSEIEGGLSMLMTCKPFLLVSTLEPQKSLAIWYNAALVFQAVWVAPNDFRTFVFEEGPWQTAIGELIANVMQAQRAAMPDNGARMH